MSPTKHYLTNPSVRPPRIRVGLALFVALAMLWHCGGPKRDYLVVFDTSGSMATDNLLGQVKGGFERLLDRAVGDGDSVSLYTFDERLRHITTVPVKASADRQKLIEEARAITVAKRNTDMWALIAGLREESARVAASGREQVIVILSDGEDAPGPRSKRKKHIDLAAFKSQQAGPVQEKYIYYLALRDQEHREVIAGLEKSIGGQVKPVAIAKGGKSEQGVTAGIDSVGRDIKVRDWLGSVAAYWPYAVGLLLILLLAWLIFFLVRNYQRSNHPEGYLLYYEEGVSAPIKSAFRLDRISTNRFRIGARTGADLKVRGLGSNDLFAFSSKRGKGGCQLKPVGSAAGQVQALHQEKPGIFQFGDRFKIGSFIFEYSETQE